MKEKWDEISCGVLFVGGVLQYGANVPRGTFTWVVVECFVPRGTFVGVWQWCWVLG